ncbi:hypothetical protein [Bradyrhizobium hereditatis]|nr:hypothetical protein [Bradyrhizobium hereditatis]
MKKKISQFLLGTAHIRRIFIFALKFIEEIDRIDTLRNRHW